MLLPVSGYVLAGGRSSRMGRDKALLRLGGQTLVEIAVEKLGEVCERVRIVGPQPALEAFAPTVQDEFVDCGPLGGFEAALRDSTHERVMVLPVDVPFLPVGLLQAWMRQQAERPEARICWLEADGFPQPLIAMMRRELLAEVEAALRAGEYRLMGLYARVAQAGEGAARCTVVGDDGALLDAEGEVCWHPTERERAEREFWFQNLNTPEEFARAEAMMSATAGSEHRS